MASVPAQALTFNLIDTGGTAVGTQARQGFDIAAAYWSSVFSDNITTNLQIGFSALGTGILGSTGSACSLLSMNQTYSALAGDRSSTLDNLAVAGLQTLGTSTLTGFGAVTVTANGFNNGTNATNGYTDLSTRIDNDGGVNNSTTAITKALGFTTDVNGAAINYSSVDAAVTFSNLFAFDFDPTDGITSAAFDFIGVAIHEIRPRARLRLGCR
jgi:hypothetical protein